MKNAPDVCDGTSASMAKAGITFRAHPHVNRLNLALETQNAAPAHRLKPHDLDQSGRSIAEDTGAWGRHFERF
jgi:hypothetical protein